MSDTAVQDAFGGAVTASLHGEQTEDMPEFPQRPTPTFAVESGACPLGGLLVEPRASIETKFQGLTEAAHFGLGVPDPTIAAGPDHILQTVNGAFGVFDRAGNLLFFDQYFDKPGEPGFFGPPAEEGVAVVDPKCFYDHYEERYVLMVLELPAPGHAFVAATDGVGHPSTWVWDFCHFSTDGLVPPSDSDIDYPGFGYDDANYYVSGNVRNPGIMGYSLFRAIPKASLTTCDTPIDVVTPNTPSIYWSPQVAHHETPPPAPYFVSRDLLVGPTDNAIVVHALDVSDPGNPVLHTEAVEVASYTASSTHPSGGVDCGETLLSPIGSPLRNAAWRDGVLQTSHTVIVNDRHLVRWYRIEVGDWPETGAPPPSCIGSGEIDPGPGVEAFYPAVFENHCGDAVMVLGAASPNIGSGFELPTLEATGRRRTDPPGTMGAFDRIAQSTVCAAPEGESSRWGDYFDATIDPLDGRTFWVTGQIEETDGWRTWIASVSVSCYADFNQDGAVNILDYVDFQEAWNVQDPCADCNNDGQFNILDFTCFQEEQVTGCP